MKKILKIIIPVLFVCTLCYFGYKIYAKVQHKKQVAENIKTIPKFSYQNINSGDFTRENLKNETPTLFIYFNSECDFCNHEAEMVKQNLKQLQYIQIVFISYEPIEKIKQFAAKFKLLTHDNITFLSDSKTTFATTFDVNVLQNFSNPNITDDFVVVKLQYNSKVNFCFNIDKTSVPNSSTKDGPIKPSKNVFIILIFEPSTQYTELNNL